MVVLVPYPSSGKGAIVGGVDSVVDRHDQRQEPGDSGENLVRDDSVLAMLIALRERIDYNKQNRPPVSKQTDRQ